MIFLPVCAFKYILSVVLHENALSHWVHPNGFSPVWAILCIRRSLLYEKDLSYCLHLISFSPIWIPICVSRDFFTLDNNGTICIPKCMCKVVMQEKWWIWARLFLRIEKYLLPIFIHKHIFERTFVWHCMKKTLS